MNIRLPWKVSSAGFADDEAGGEEEAAGGEGGVGDAFAHGVEGGEGDVPAGLLDGGEGDGEEGGEADIIEADEAEVLGCFDAEAGTGLEKLGGGVVVGADDGIEGAGGGEALDEFEIGGVSGVDEITVATSLNSFALALATTPSEAKPTTDDTATTLMRLNILAPL